MKLIADQRVLLNQVNNDYDRELKILDQEAYRQDLQTRKNINFGICYLKATDLIPESYALDSFKFYKTDKWKLEMTVLMDQKRRRVPNN